MNILICDDNKDIVVQEEFVILCELYPDTMIMLMKEGIDN